MDYPIKISVVMPTYNTPVPMLKEAIDSILNQTFTDFEFIIIDDGSTNDSPCYLDNLRDERIVLIHNPQNIGITKTLNIGFNTAKGKYIARMDSDDISLPSRFEKQYSYMEKHPDVVVCGTNLEFFGGREGFSNWHDPDYETSKITLLFHYNGPPHPTAFFRHETLLKHNLSYNEKLIYSQDYGLYAEISKYGRIVILDDILHKYRIHSHQINQLHRKEQIDCDKYIQKKLLLQLLDHVTDEELDMHYKYSYGIYRDQKINSDISKWYDRLITANKHRHIYNNRKFAKKIDEIKKRLAGQTFTTEMSKFEKGKLLFRYLSFEAAFSGLLEILLLKFQGFFLSKNNKTNRNFTGK